MYGIYNDRIGCFLHGFTGYHTEAEALADILENLCTDDEPTPEDYLTAHGMRITEQHERRTR